MQIHATNATPEFVDASSVQVFKGDLTAETYEQFSSQDKLAWDIETNGLDPHTSRIGTCQLYHPAMGPCVVTCLADEKPTRLSKLLADKSVMKVFHHAPFDLAFMAYAWDIQPRNVACTKIAAKLITPGAPPEHYSLKYLMSRHFGLELDKSIRFTDWLSCSLSQRQLQYAVGDVIKLLDLYELLNEGVRSHDLLGMYEECLSFLPSHVQMRLHGCPDPFSY